MNSQTYLKNYVERVCDVPAYLRRHLALIRCATRKSTQQKPYCLSDFADRDLDEKVEALQQEIATKKHSAPKHYDLESNVTRLVSLADEKVGHN